MRTVIKIISALALVAVAAGPARADSTYFTTRTLLAAFFPKSEKVGYQTVELRGALRARVAQRLGYQPARDHYTVFVASTDGRVDGYAVVDDEPGQHQPITFGVKLSARGIVERMEIVAYREPRGDEVRDARFRKQFAGKSAQDALRVGRDIDAVSGATISSHAMATGVRRAAVLVEEAVLGASTLASAGQARR